VSTYVAKVGSPTSYVAVEQRARYAQPGIIASDDGVEWRAAWHLDFYRQLEVAGLLKRDTNRRFSATEGSVVFRSAEKAPAELIPLLEWAKKSATPQTPNAVTASRRLTEEQLRIAPCAVIGQVRVEGWGRISRRSAHTFDGLVGVVSAAVTLCARQWQWRPDGLSVMVHEDDSAMGLAYKPGDGDRRISLKADLFTNYDLESIRRTVLHELCHHAREELFVRDRFPGFDSHDAKFCELLGMVDPVIRSDPRACEFFTDHQDAGVVASVSAQKGIVYAVNAGELRVGFGPDRRGRMRWDATGARRWRSSWQKLTSDSLTVFLRQFQPSERANVRVVPDEEDTRHKPLVPYASTALAFARGLTVAHPKIFSGIEEVFQ
jgi:hypothetical protein